MSGETDDADHSSAGKADFADIYDQPDPRAYFAGLGQWDYEIPAHGAAVFSTLLDAQRQLKGQDVAESPTVVDLCCSYGVNAALLKCDLTLADLYAHYRADEFAAASPEEVVEADREFYTRHCRAPTQAQVPQHRGHRQLGQRGGLRHHRGPARLRLGPRPRTRRTPARLP